MLQIHKALIPALRHQEVLRRLSRPLFGTHVAQPDENAEVISNHNSDAGCELVHVSGNVQGNNKEFYAGVSAEAQSDTKALLPPRDAKVTGKKKKKQN